MCTPEYTCAHLYCKCYQCIDYDRQCDVYIVYLIDKIVIEIIYYFKTTTESLKHNCQIT